MLGALLVAVPIAVVFSRRARRWGRSEIGLLAVVFLACAFHGLLDALTDAGLGVGFFIPFDDGRYFFPWRPVRTSPLSVGAFFSRTGVEILTNEIVWVDPVALVTAVVCRRKAGARMREELAHERDIDPSWRGAGARRNQSHRHRAHALRVGPSPG